MKKHELLVIIMLFLLGMTTRLPFIEQMQSHWDGPQYSIGVIRYSLEQHTPAPLGYPLYIELARLFHHFISDPFKSILMVSVLTSGIGTVVFYFLGRIFANPKVGLITAALYLSAPTIYFFGLTAYPYGMVPVIVAALGISIFTIISKRTGSGLLLSWLFSIAIAIRPQELLPFTCMYLYGFWHLKKDEKLRSFIAACIFTALWLIPFLTIVGGVEKYIAVTKSFLDDGAIQGLTLAKLVHHMESMGKGFFLTFTLSSLFLIYYPLRYRWKYRKKLVRNKYLQIFFVWFFPSFISNLFIRSDHAGYQMIYLSALFVPIAYAVYRVGKMNNRYLILMLLCVIVNLWWFFRDRDPMLNRPYVPTSFHYSEIRKNDMRMSEQVGYIKENFNPDTSIVITSSQAWRPFMYHLPKFRVINLEGIFTKDPQYVDTVYESRGLDYKRYNNNSRTYIIPKGITSLLFVDGGIDFNVISHERIPFKHSEITVVFVKPSEMYTYDYNAFRK